MTQLGCFTPVMACRLRIGRLDAAGTPLDGPNDIVVTDSLVRIGYQVQVDAGTLITKTNGCGKNCVRRQSPDQVGGVNLTLELCKSDYEADELLTGAALVLVDGIVRGSTIPDIDTDLTQYVSVEAWAEAWDGDEQAVDDDGNVLYTRYVFPKTTWVPGDRAAEEAAAAILYTGRGFSNSQFGTGPGDDLPDGVYITPKGEWIDSDGLPEANCGYAFAS